MILSHSFETKDDCMPKARMRLNTETKSISPHIALFAHIRKSVSCQRCLALLQVLQTDNSITALLWGGTVRGALDHIGCYRIPVCKKGHHLAFPLTLVLWKPGTNCRLSHGMP